VPMPGGNQNPGLYQFALKSAVLTPGNIPSAKRIIFADGLPHLTCIYTYLAGFAASPLLPSN
jgi:hypothetical protein